MMVNTQVRGETGNRGAASAAVLRCGARIRDDDCIIYHFHPTLSSVLCRSLTDFGDWGFAIVGVAEHLMAGIARNCPRIRGGVRSSKKRPHEPHPGHNRRPTPTSRVSTALPCAAYARANTLLPCAGQDVQLQQCNSCSCRLNRVPLKPFKPLERPNQQHAPRCPTYCPSAGPRAAGSCPPPGHQGGLLLHVDVFLSRQPEPSARHLRVPAAVPGTDSARGSSDGASAA